MSGIDQLTEIAARLASDPEFCRAFHRDPAAVCRAHGLDEDAAAYIARAARTSALEPRESRSSLGSAVVAGALDGVAAAHHHGGPSLAVHTGRITAIGSATGPDVHPGDGPSRERIASWMGDEAARHGLPRELPVMAALVESDLQNLDHGDAASVGYFQMQTTQWLERYPGYPDKPELQLRWFIDQALAVRERRPELAGDPSRWGEWVAEIERPRSDLRWKYGARLADARELLREHSDPRPVVARTGALPSARAARELPMLADGRTGAGRALGYADRLKAEAGRVDGAHVPYEWGGGHASRQPYGSPVTPLDCRARSRACSASIRAWPPTSRPGANPVRASA